MHPFEYKFLKRFEALGLRGKTVLVACSGGLDSVVLAKVALALAPTLDMRVVLAHIHHGDAASPEQLAFRDQAASFVEKLHRDIQIIRLQGELKSEEELRDARRTALELLAIELRAEACLLAHHADDLLETRLIRLIRGTGASGLEAMQERRGILVRPLLNENRLNLEQYAQETKLVWCEDPSNANSDPLRNWIRNDWLPSLEQKRPGGVKTLQRSLEQVVETLVSASPSSVTQPSALGRLDRFAYVQMSESHQKESVRNLLASLNRRDFAAKHVDEIRKRLASKKDRMRFVLLGLEWQINAEQVVVSAHNLNT